MNIGRTIFPILLLLASATSAQTSNGRIKVGMYVPGGQPIQSLAPDGSFGEPVTFVVEPLISDTPTNVLRAQKEIWWYCYVDGVGMVPDCVITLFWAARPNSGGHIHEHVGTRPRGQFSRSFGRVDQSDLYFKTTYYSSEVSGIIDVLSDCNQCTEGDLSTIGVGLTGMVEIPAPASDDSGYTLTGADQYHPFNHFGQSDFVYAVLSAFSTYHEETNLKIRANDLSLELGGIFDIQTGSKAGYDWTRPHRYHRLGQSMDTSIPPTKRARAVYTQALAAGGIIPLHEDSRHWHLHAGAHL